MTPTEIETSARQRYNSVGDTFWSQQEIIDLMYDACLDLCRDAYVIERLYTASTVASTRNYDYPTNAIAIKRITYEGKKLQLTDFREDDAITGLDQSSADTGTPRYYSVWNGQIYLRPTPDSIGTLQIFTYNRPSPLTVASTLEIPTEFHMDLVTYVCGEMAAKDSNIPVAQYYMERWEKKKKDAKRYMILLRRTDAFAVVKAEESLNESYLGTI